MKRPPFGFILLDLLQNLSFVFNTSACYSSERIAEDKAMKIQK